MGKTGQLIVRAIVAGERDGAVLAGFRDGRCKADAATIAASLRGNWRDEHLFALEQALQRYDALQGQIAACEERINGELDRLARADSGDPPEDGRSPRAASPLGVKETHTRKKLFHASAREQIVLSGRRRGDLLLLAAQTGGCRLCHSVVCS